MGTTEQVEGQHITASPGTDGISGGAEAGFTPGPWESSANHVWVGGPDGANICTVGSPRKSPWVGYTELSIGDPDAREAYANVRLIAAAPDLLYALAQIVADLPSRRDWLDPTIEAAARAAIAKATASATPKSEVAVPSEASAPSTGEQP